MKNSARRSMLKTVAALICALMLLTGVIPAGAKTTAPTQNPDITYGDLLDMGLAEITSYGVVAEIYHQSGHAETSVAATTVDKKSGDPFMPTVDTLNDQGELIITPTVTVNGAHDAFSTRFALFRKDGNGYARVTDPVTAQFTAQGGSETITLSPFSITDQTVKMAGVYLMEVDSSGNYVLNGEIGDHDYTVQYGDEAGVDPLPVQSTQLISYIGSIDLSQGQNTSDVKLMQGTAFPGQRVDFGPNIHLYEKNGSTYTKVDGSTTHAVSQLYIRDDTWASGVYKQFLNVSYDGAGKFNYGGYEIQFGFDKGSPEGDQDYAAYLLDRATAISQMLAGPEVTGATSDGKPGGTLKNGVKVVSQNANDEYWGNGTVASWEELGGKYGNTTLTFYCVEVKNGAIDLKDLDPTPNTEIQNQGVPISDNEYIVINVICPSRDGTINGSQEPLKLKDESGNTINPGQWRSGGASAYSRVIWNYVYLAPDGTYQPFEGHIVHQRTSPGLNFAPKATVDVKDVGDAVSYVVKEVENFGVELHQTLHEPVSRSVKALLYKGGLIVLKKDSNGDAVEGAVFTVYSDAACTQVAYTFNPTAIGVDSDHPDLAAAMLNHIEPGTYYVKETSVPDDYVMDETVYTVEIVSSDTLTYVNGGTPIVNEVEGARGYIDIIKADSANSSTKLAGATFGIYKDSNCTQKAGELGPTDENGYALSKALAEGDYYIKEIVAPAGYALNENARYTVTVVGDSTVHVNNGNPVPNDKVYGDIDVYKVDADNTNTKLAGAEFTVYTDTMCTEVYDTLGPTNSSGYAKLQHLPVGSYWVKETTTPQGYAPDGTVYTVVVTENGLTTVNTSVVTNRAGHGQICLYKAAAEDETKMLEDAVYYIYTDPSCTDEYRLEVPGITNAFVMYRSDETGYAHSQTIPFGTYYVKEQTAPNHYKVSNEVYTVEVNNETVPAQIIGPGAVNAALLDEWEDNPKGQIKVYKADADNPNTALTGAKFGVYSDPDCTELVTTMTTSGSTGYAKTDWIPFGTYYVQEITPPSGYDLDFTIYEIPVYDSANTAQVMGTGPSSSRHQVLNKKSEGKGRIRVRKEDTAVSGKMLAGAKFKIYADEDCTEYVTTLVTGDDGTALSEYLPIGEYWVKEVEAPEGYSIDRTTPQKFTLKLSSSGSAQTYSWTWYDTKGATARIYARKDLAGKTDTDAQFSFELSSYSSSYPMPDADQRVITVADGETGSFGRIDFTESDLHGRESYPYTYTVSEIIPDDSDKVPNVLYDEETYDVFIELKKVDGELVAECIDFYKDGSHIGSESDPIVITNTYDGGHIKVTKADHNDSSIPLEGAVFKVYDNEDCEGEPVASLTTGSDGTAQTEEPLPSGHYWVQELIAPRGYTIDEPDPVEVVVTKDETADAPVVLDFTDTEMTASASLKVQKTLGSGLTTSEKFTFKLTAKTEGAPMPANTTIEVAGGETGVFDEIDFKGTDLGTDTSKVFEYEITEVMPEDPTYGVVYDTTPRTVSITLRIVNNRLRAIPSTNSAVPEVINTYGEGYIKVVKADADIADTYLPDAEFEIYDNEECTGDPVATLTTGDDGTAMSEALPVGNYWIVETSAPEGYQIDNAEAVKVTVTKDHTAALPLTETFTDTMAASVQMYAKKAVTGKNDNTTVFTFTLSADASGIPMPEETTVDVKNGETKTFGEITYTYADLDGETSKEFEYTIQELIPTQVPKGWTYDTEAHKVKVKLQYSSGALTATLVSAADNEPLGTEADPVIVTNTYEAKGGITFTGTKTMDGRALTADDKFTFTVKEGTETVATGANNGTGTITFTKIEYDEEDLGTHTYKITEDATTIDGVTKDSTELTVVVEVTDNGDGTLKAEISTTSPAIAFTNTYEAKGDITFTGTKAMSGRALTADDKFTFTVKEGTETVATGANNGTGTITFT
ncbi:MAG: SpaA isopeptide-forming pilin-related protein, partial [Clostridia bacterium]|nr:SpaA isopeptide-forming pilin-related protein [Clostridia bacterium]